MDDATVIKGTALSIRQPWAWLIISGYKDIENRTWKTNFRGTVYVHAPLKFDTAGYEHINRRFNIDMPARNKFLQGGLVGTVDVVDCITEHNSPWFEGSYGFVLEKPRPIAFIPLKGRLGFFPFDTTPADE